MVDLLASCGFPALRPGLFFSKKIVKDNPLKPLPCVRCNKIGRLTPGVIAHLKLRIGHAQHSGPEEPRDGYSFIDKVTTVIYGNKKHVGIYLRLDLT